MRKLWIQFVKGIIELNEKLIFNKRLLKYYRSELPSRLRLVIDVGVNTGQSIELFKKLDSECSIIGFEPNPALFLMLQRKYSSDSKVELHQLGISNEEGSRTFHENVLHSTSTFEDLNFDSSYLARKAKLLGVKKEDLVSKSYPVETVTLSDYINKNCSSDIDILKIDTEGHEYQCLEGLFLEELKVKIGYIQIEEHNDDMYLNKKPFVEIQKLLHDNGYRIEARVPHGFGDFQEVVFKRV